MAMVDNQKYLFFRVFGRTNSLRFNALSLAGRGHLTVSNLPSALTPSNSVTILLLLSYSSNLL